MLFLAWAEPSPAPNRIVSRIPREPVESSAIAKIGYSKRRHILEIEFVNGAVYRYLDVPLTTYSDLMSAESKTAFLRFKYPPTLSIDSGERSNSRSK